MYGTHSLMYEEDTYVYLHWTNHVTCKFHARIHFCLVIIFFS